MWTYASGRARWAAIYTVLPSYFIEVAAQVVIASHKMQMFLSKKGKSWPLAANFGEIWKNLVGKTLPCDTVSAVCIGGIGPPQYTP